MVLFDRRLRVNMWRLSDKGVRGLGTSKQQRPDWWKVEGFMHKILGIVIVIMAAMVSSTAQTGPNGTRYSEAKSVNLRTDAVEASYPRTSYSYPAEDFKPGVVRVGPRTTYLKEGLRTDEVVRLLGKPVSISERSDNDVVIATYQFRRGDGRMLIAEFVGGVLVRSRLETRVEHPVQADN